MTSVDRRIAIVGTGRLARALGRVLADAREPVVALAGRSPQRAAEAASFIGRSVKPIGIADVVSVAGRVLIAVSDDAIRTVAGELAGRGLPHGIVLHTSGAHGPDLLAALAVTGTACGVLHPLQTIATPELGIAVLRGATFGIGGDPAAVDWAQQLVAAAAGTPLRIPPDGFASYHAGAVMASNAVVAVIDAAVVLLGAAGVEQRAALHAIRPLCLTSAGNALEIGPDAALTGPIQRGDADTIRKHVTALASCPPHVAELYRASARELIAIARRRGLNQEAAMQVERALES